MNEINGQEIYDGIKKQLDELVESFGNKDIDDEELKEIQVSVINNITDQKEKFEVLIDQLKQNSDWDTFSIALYGENNAGKSTLVEVLRILLNEQKKIIQRENYKTRSNEIEKLQHEIENINENEHEIEVQCKNDQEEINSKIQVIESKAEEHASESLALSKTLQAQQEKLLEEMIASTWTLLKAFFNKLEGQNEARTLESRILTIDEQITGDDEEIHQLHKDIEKVEERYQDQHSQLESKRKAVKRQQDEIAPFLLASLDGEIIGDQRSDFTRKVTKYYFENNGQKFQLLDLPGIEGNEDSVIKEINNAVETAHAVLYIKRDMTLIQVGDGKTEGTLDKIKKHLSQEQEVYVVFNISTLSKRKLAHKLISDEDVQQAEDTDKLMQETIGDAYSGHKIISAYPAFLAEANTWPIPDTKFKGFDKKKHEFLKKAEELGIDLLEWTQIKDFVQWLTTTLVSDSKQKIVTANNRKVQYQLEQLHSQIKDSSDKWNDKVRIVKKYYERAIKEVSEQESTLRRNLDNNLESIIFNSQANVKNQINDEIERDINNSQFKETLKDLLEKETSVVEQKFKESSESEFDNFSKRINGILLKANQNIQNDITLMTEISDFSDVFNFEIKEKSKMGEIFGIVTSIASLQFVPGVGQLFDVVVTVAMIVSAAWHVVKGIIGIFSTKYRKSQQRVKTTEALEKWAEEVKKQYKEALKEGLNEVDSATKEIVQKLNYQINSFNQQQTIFERTLKQVGQIAKEIN